MLPGYRLVWMRVMSDLPMLDKAERKAAADFRNALLDPGFEMTRFSVYIRFCTGPVQVDTCCKRIEAALAAAGKVNIMQFTDKQDERIISFHGKTRQAPQKAPDQFDLFQGGYMLFQLENLINPFVIKGLVRFEFS